jgi:hypothetical protein
MGWGAGKGETKALRIACTVAACSVALAVAFSAPF